MDICRLLRYLEEVDIGYFVRLGQGDWDTPAIALLMTRYFDTLGS